MDQSEQSYTDKSQQYNTTQHETNNNSKQNASKQAIRNEFTACLGVWMHHWHAVEETLPLHLITLIQVSGEHSGKPKKYLHHQASRGDALSTQHITSQPTEFTSLAECATVDIPAFSSRSVVYGHARQVVCNFTTQNSNKHAKHDYKSKYIMQLKTAELLTHHKVCANKSQHTLYPIVSHIPKHLLSHARSGRGHHLVAQSWVAIYTTFACLLICCHSRYLILQAKSTHGQKKPVASHIPLSWS